MSRIHISQRKKNSELHWNVVECNGDVEANINFEACYQPV
jgi:hypothetical protein